MSPSSVACPASRRGHCSAGVSSLEHPAPRLRPVIGPGERIARVGLGTPRPSGSRVYATQMLVLMSLLTSAIYLPSLIQPTFRSSTQHFRVLATAANRADGEAVAGSESIREQLVERFGTPGPASLDVELTGARRGLRARIVQLRTDADLQVFAHGSPHAFSHHLGDVSHHQRAWRFFEEATHNEGLVESQAATQRGTASADWLLLPTQLRSMRFDPDADYALGQVWVEALIEPGATRLQGA